MLSLQECKSTQESLRTQQLGTGGQIMGLYLEHIKNNAYGIHPDNRSVVIKKLYGFSAFAVFEGGQGATLKLSHAE